MLYLNANLDLYNKQKILLSGITNFVIFFTFVHNNRLYRVGVAPAGEFVHVIQMFLFPLTIKQNISEEINNGNGCNFYGMIKCGHAMLSHIVADNLGAYKHRQQNSPNISC